MNAAAGRPDPSLWTIALGRWDITEGRLEARPADRDGNDAALGRCEVYYALPGRGSWSLVFICDAVSQDPSGISLVVDNIRFSLGVSGNRESALLVSDVIEALAPVRAVPGRQHRLSVRSEGRELVFTVDGQETFRHLPARPRPFGRVGLMSWSAAAFSDLTMVFQEPAGATGRSPVEPFRLCCAVDFLDDMRRCAWTEDMIAEYMVRLRELGVTRVYWEDVHHLRDDFLTDSVVTELARRDLARHGAGVWETMKQGWDEFAVATRKAHEAGLEMYALLKPFDWHYYDPQNGKGNWNRAQRFIFRNQDKTMQRRPRLERFAPDDAPVGKVRLVSMSDAPFGFDPEDVELWVSDDNETYRQYAGPLERTESVGTRTFVDWWTGEAEPPQAVRVLTLGGLNLSSRHFAIRCGRDGRTLRNRLYRLVEVESTDGRPTEVTFGIVSRDETDDSPGARRSRVHGVVPTTRRSSFSWDYNSGVPSATLGGRDVIEHFRAIDGDGGWLGLTRGGMRQPRRDWITLCPAYPEVREMFLWTVRHALDSGADGIDLREGAHQRCHSWALRGFNPPMIEAFRARYGADPSRVPYDRAKFGGLAGEFYDLFVEEAAALCRRRGRRIQHHIFARADLTARERGFMNMRFDWRKWIERGWLDAVTLKNIAPGTAFFHEVVSVADDAGVETYACPYLNTVMMSQWRAGPAPRHETWRPILGGMVRDACERGCDGFILYEGAAFVTGTEDGRVEHLFPDAARVLGDALKRLRSL